MRIAIVNDAPTAVAAIRQAVDSVEGHEIVWIAANGAEAVENCERNRPDLVLMDLSMPIMDGTEATRLIMQKTPCAVLVVTATVSGHAAEVFQAMGYGALDAADEPVLGPAGRLEGGEALLRKIAMIGRLIGVRGSDRRRSGARPPRPPWAAAMPPLVAIGASTGGPKALAAILSAMPRDLGAALTIVQHVDASMAGGLAEWLQGQTPLEVVLARDGDCPRPNAVFVAATRDHIVIGEDLAFHYRAEPKDYPFRPSVDTFFSSVATNVPGRGVAVLLTGMGSDGAKGLLALRQAGWHTIAQDRATSVVYGMPKVAAELGAATDILPLSAIPGRILTLLGRGSVPL